MSIDGNIEKLPITIARKEAIIEQLKDAFSLGKLSLDDFEYRVAIAENTYEITKLENLVIDLPKQEIPNEITELETITCNMATKKLSGTILQTKRIRIEASMSTLTINYLEEKPIKGIQIIDLNTNMTNLILYLPDDVVVDNKLSEDMTTFKEYRNRYYDPGNAKTLIKITGTSKMTKIKIKRKKYWFFQKKKIK